MSRNAEGVRYLTWLEAELESPCQREVVILTRAGLLPIEITLGTDMYRCADGRGEARPVAEEGG